MILGLLGTAVSTVGNLLNTERQNQSNQNYYQQMNKWLGEERRELDNLFNANYYRGIMDRSDVQHLMGQFRDQAKERARSFRNSAAVMGYTPEVAVAQANNEAKAFGNMAASIASQGTGMKEGALSNYINQRSALNGKVQDLWSRQYQDSAKLENEKWNMGLNLLDSLF